jgi:hypothetical protein
MFFLDGCCLSVYAWKPLDRGLTLGLGLGVILGRHPRLQMEDR